MGDIEQRSWERLRAVAAGNRSEWQRTVMENRELQVALSRIRAKYGLPLPTLNAFAFYEEQSRLAQKNLDARMREYEKEHGEGSLVGKTFTSRMPLIDDLERLAKGYNLDWKKWGRNLQILAVFGAEQAPLSFGMGFPGATTTFLDGGGCLQQVNLEPSVDVTNPLVQDFVARIHKRNVLVTDPPPEPVPVDGSRALDWRPVQEWLKRHPDFTYDDVAPYVGRTANTVRKKVAELGGK